MSTFRVAPHAPAGTGGGAAAVPSSAGLGIDAVTFVSAPSSPGMNPSTPAGAFGAAASSASMAQAALPTRLEWRNVQALLQSVSHHQAPHAAVPSGKHQRPSSGLQLGHSGRRGTSASGMRHAASASRRPTSPDAVSGDDAPPTTTTEAPRHIFCTNCRSDAHTRADCPQEIRCYVCLQPGHEAYVCVANPAPGSCAFLEDVRCNYCHELGHHGAKCKARGGPHHGRPGTQHSKGSAFPRPLVVHVGSDSGPSTVEQRRAREDIAAVLPKALRQKFAQGTMTDAELFAAGLATMGDDDAWVHLRGTSPGGPSFTGGGLHMSGSAFMSTTSTAIAAAAESAAQSAVQRQRLISGLLTLRSTASALLVATVKPPPGALGDGAAAVSKQRALDGIDGGGGGATQPTLHELKSSQMDFHVVFGGRVERYRRALADAAPLPEPTEEQKEAQARISTVHSTDSIVRRWPYVPGDEERHRQRRKKQRDTDESQRIASQAVAEGTDAAFMERRQKLSQLHNTLRQLESDVLLADEVQGTHSAASSPFGGAASPLGASMVAAPPTGIPATGTGKGAVGKGPSTTTGLVDFSQSATLPLNVAAGLLGTPRQPQSPRSVGVAPRQSHRTPRPPTAPSGQPQQEPNQRLILATALRRQWSAKVRTNNAGSTPRDAGAAGGGMTTPIPIGGSLRSVGSAAPADGASTVGGGGISDLRSDLQRHLESGDCRVDNKFPLAPHQRTGPRGRHATAAPAPNTARRPASAMTTPASRPASARGFPTTFKESPPSQQPTEGQSPPHPPLFFVTELSQQQQQQQLPPHGAAAPPLSPASVMHGSDGGGYGATAPPSAPVLNWAVYQALNTAAADDALRVGRRDESKSKTATATAAAVSPPSKTGASDGPAPPPHPPPQHQPDSALDHVVSRWKGRYMRTKLVKNFATKVQLDVRDAHRAVVQASPRAMAAVAEAAMVKGRQWLVSHVAPGTPRSGVAAVPSSSTGATGAQQVSSVPDDVAALVSAPDNGCCSLWSAQCLTMAMEEVAGQVCRGILRSVEEYLVRAKGPRSDEAQRIMHAFTGVISTYDSYSSQQPMPTTAAHQQHSATRGGADRFGGGGGDASLGSTMQQSTRKSASRSVVASSAQGAAREAFDAVDADRVYRWTVERAFKGQPTSTPRTLEAERLLQLIRAVLDDAAGGNTV